MKKKILVGSLVLLSALAASLHAGDESPISVKAEVDRAVITIGDPVTYSIMIRSDPGIQVLSSIPYPPKDIFQIKKIEEVKTEDAGMNITGRKFTLTAFQLGEYILDPVAVEYRMKGGDEKGSKAEEIKKIETNRIFITVKSVGDGKPATDIRGIKSVLTIPLKIAGIAAAVAAILLAIAGPVFARWWNSRKMKPAVPKPILSPEQEAMEKLNRLFDSELLRQGKIKEYYFSLSEILRIFLESRYKISAVESTTAEIVRLFKDVSVSAELKNKIRDVLEAADLAKFAKWKPEPADVLHINKQSVEIIEASKPKESGDGI